MLWPSLPAKKQYVRVLLVADPQLVGMREEGGLLGSLARWDADSYLRRNFHAAVSYSKPDVIVFLGDLMGEGRISSDEEYLDYGRMLMAW